MWGQPPGLSAERSEAARDPATCSEAPGFWVAQRFSVCVRTRFFASRWNQVLWFSREAAKECSPQLALSSPKGRKPWVESGKGASPGGAKEYFSRILFSPETTALAEARRQSSRYNILVPEASTREASAEVAPGPSPASLSASASSSASSSPPDTGSSASSAPPCAYASRAKKARSKPSASAP
jgi:hypothetical protein